MYHTHMDYTAWYRRITQPFRKTGFTRALGTADRVLVGGFAFAYVALIVALIVRGSSALLTCIVVPAVTFVLVTLLRILINRPRPYEAHDIEPLVFKDTQGKSMPSRHMSSAVIITFAYFQVWPIVGGALFVACVCIAFVRIVGGVHYPSDILVAAVLSVLCGVAGFAVL